MPEMFESPLPEGDLYIIWDAKEHRGWWTGGGGYSIWPHGARIYTADEADNVLKRSAAYVSIFTLSELEHACDAFQAGANQARERLESQGKGRQS